MSDEAEPGPGVILAQALVPAALVGVVIAAVDLAGLAARGLLTPRHGLGCAVADLALGAVILPAALAERLLRRRGPPARGATAVAGAAVLVATAAAIVVGEAMLGYAYALDPEVGAKNLARTLSFFASVPVKVGALALGLAAPFVPAALLRARGRGPALQVGACLAGGLVGLLPVTWAWDAIAMNVLIGPLPAAAGFLAFAAALPLLLLLADAVERALVRWARP